MKVYSRLAILFIMCSPIKASSHEYNVAMEMAWVDRGFVELIDPPIGGRRDVHFRQRYSIIPGVGFTSPPDIVAIEEGERTFDMYQNDWSSVYNEVDRPTFDPLDSGGVLYFAESQVHGQFDYKNRSDLPDFPRVKDDIGNFVNGVAGSLVSSRDQLTYWTGLVKSMQSHNLYGDTSSFTAGNKPSGLVMSQMGTEYAESGQLIRDFIYRKNSDYLWSLNSAPLDKEAALENASRVSYTVEKRLRLDRLFNDLDKAQANAGNLALRKQVNAERLRLDETEAEIARLNKIVAQRSELERRRRQVYIEERAMVKQMNAHNHNWFTEALQKIGVGAPSSEGQGDASGDGGAGGGGSGDCGPNCLTTQGE